MRYIVPVSLLIAAFIHALPLVGVIGAEKLQSLYDIPMGDPNLEILMRHRAVLFGLLAVFLAHAAFRPAFQGIALLGGLVSVIAFLALAFTVDSYNDALSTIVRADILALAALLGGAAVHLTYRRRIRGL